MSTEGAGRRFELAPQDEGWPGLVPPSSEIPRIYGIGDPQVLLGPCLSVVGARRGTPYGLAVAAMAGRLAAEVGITVVSGGALGVDAASALAALDAGGRTVVVAGSGADVVYPEVNRDVFRRAVAQGGAVVALEPWGTPPRKYTFRKRNRLISALSPVLLVCEAGIPSGTFSTADAAAELGRTVYAAPGSMFSAFSKGTNRLIAQGATILEDELSLETALSMDYGVLRLSPTGAPVAQPDRLLSALIAQPLRVDDVAAHLGVTVLEALQLLAEKEVEGLVTKLPDGTYAPTERAYARFSGPAGGAGGIG